MNNTILEMVQDTANALHDAGIMSESAMRKFRSLRPKTSKQIESKPRKPVQQTKQTFDV